MFGFAKGSRVGILAAFLFVGIAAIIVRLFQIQILDHERYVNMGNDEYIKRLTIPAKRGLLYAMDNGEPVPIVVNETIFTVFVDPKIVDNPYKVENVIKSVAGGNITSDISEALAQKDSRYQIVAKELTRQQAEMIKKEKLTGVGFHEGTRRVYPEGALAAQTLGFVNRDGEGQYGAEAAFDEELKGRDGRLESVTDIGQVPLTIGDKNIHEPAQDGANVVLTIDRNVQMKAEQALRAGLDRIDPDHATGSVIVMDPNTGQVLAIANWPSFEPEKFMEVDDAALFQSSALVNSYEPGSVVKTFIMATGLDQGVISPETTYYNRDTIEVDDRHIANAYKGLLGNITMQTVLNYSLNTGAVTVAKLLGGGEINSRAIDTMFDYYHDRFGFGLRTGIELYEEQGIVISPDDEDGNAVRYSNMTFGQGMNITMIQALAGFSSAINGGNYYRPTVKAGLVGEDGKLSDATRPDLVRQTVSPQTSATLRGMLMTTRGLMFGSKDTPGYQVGGKTGTTETLSAGGYTQATTIGSYLGFGGNSTAKYAIMVRVESEGRNLEGGIHAEPIFAELSNWMLNYLRVEKE